MRSRSSVILSLVLLGVVSGALWTVPQALRAQGVDVFLNVTAGGAKKLNIAIPEFTVVTGKDAGVRLNGNTPTFDPIHCF